MLAFVRVLAIAFGCLSSLRLAAADDAEQASATSVEIHWVEPFRVTGLTVDRSAHNGSDTENDYYPHMRPALILKREDVAETQLTEVKWLMNDVVVRHYSVTLVLTKDARERLAKCCPGKSARVTVSVDGKYWGWDHYNKDKNADASARFHATNYNPCMGLMPLADAERIVSTFK